MTPPPACRCQWRMHAYIRGGKGICPHLPMPLADACLSQMSTLTVTVSILFITPTTVYVVAEQRLGGGEGGVLGGEVLGVC